jgi:hypothetical protein
LTFLFPARLGPPKRFNLPATVHTSRIAVQPPISTIHCKTLNNLIRMCYTPPVVTAMNPRRSRPPENAQIDVSACFRAISFPFTLLRTLLHCSKTHLFCFQSIPHSLRKTTRGGGRERFPFRDPFEAAFHLPYTLPSSVSRNSFVCHSCANTGGVGVILPISERALHSKRLAVLPSWPCARLASSP